MWKEVLSPANILIVDDQHHQRILLKTILRGFGVRQVSEAADGAEGLRELRDFPPDIVITDLRMTPLDGIEMVRLLRTASDIPRPDIPVLMLTGHCSKDTVLRARDAGVNEFLAKPVTPQSLVRHMAEALRRDRRFIRSATYAGPCRRRRDRPYCGEDRRKPAAEAPGQALEILPGMTRGDCGLWR